MTAWAFTSAFDKKGDTKPNINLDPLCCLLVAVFLCGGVSALTEERVVLSPRRQSAARPFK